jgi:hypothetical protein
MELQDRDQLPDSVSCSDESFETALDPTMADSGSVPLQVLVRERDGSVFSPFPVHNSDPIQAKCKLEEGGWPPEQPFIAYARAKEVREGIFQLTSEAKSSLQTTVSGQFYLKPGRGPPETCCGCCCVIQ